MELNELAKALNKAQSVMKAAKKDKVNPFFRSNYSDLASVFDAIRQPFADNGLSVSQPMRVLDNGRTILDTIIFHTSGQSITSSMLIPDVKKPQELGSMLTYFRRYALMAIAGLPADDDDGNEANKSDLNDPARKLIGEEGARVLDDQLQENEEYRQQVLEWLSKSNRKMDSLTQDEAAKVRSKIGGA